MAAPAFGDPFGLGSESSAADGCALRENDRAHRGLAKQFADHGRTGPLERAYLAFVWGVPGRPKGTINAPLDRHPRARDKQAVRTGGREAITHWERLETYNGTDGKPVASLLSCRLETGRTHQIRVHFAAAGHPVLGDRVYGRRGETERRAPRQMLHARKLGFPHPRTGEPVVAESPLPEDFSRLLETLRMARKKRPGKAGPRQTR